MSRSFQWATIKPYRDSSPSKQLLLPWYHQMNAPLHLHTDLCFFSLCPKIQHVSSDNEETWVISFVLTVQTVFQNTWAEYLWNRTVVGQNQVHIPLWLQLSPVAFSKIQQLHQVMIRVILFEFITSCRMTPNGAEKHI